MPGRNPFTQREDDLLAQYIAANHPQVQGRLGNELYHKLVDNPDKYPWSETHPWSSWRERYKMNKDEFDRKIRRYLKNGNLEVERLDDASQRNFFTENEDKLLCKFIAVYNPQIKGRNGNALYKTLVENAKGKWNWSRTHSWQAWRGRYVAHAEEFNERIAEYQARLRAKPSKVSTEGASKEQDTNDSMRPRKRQRLTTEDIKQENEEVDVGQPSVDRHGPNGHTSKTEPAKAQYHPNEPEESSQDEDDDSPSDRPPPGSEDYHGQIFPESTENENPATRDSVDPSGEGEGEAQVEQGASSENSPADEDATDGLDFHPSEITNEMEQSPTPHSEYEREVENPTVSGSAKRRKRRRINDDPFEDYVPPSPEQSPIGSKSRKRPVVLTENPFRTTLQQTQTVASPTKSIGDVGKDISSSSLLPRASNNEEHANHPEGDVVDNQLSTKRTTMDERSPETPIMDVTSEVSNGFPIDQSINENKSSGESDSTRRSRHIDLRQELANKKRIRESSQQSQPPVSDDEENRMLREIVVQHLSEKFDFTQSFVRRLWKDLKSVRLVQDTLTDMRSRVEQSRISMMNKSRHSDQDTSMRQTASKSRSPAKLRKSLDIVPIADTSMDLDYDPPSGSRAGKYARLVKMGREDEARERERRRVSGIAVSPKRVEQPAIKSLSGATQLLDNSGHRMVGKDATVNLADQDEDVFLDHVHPSQIKHNVLAEPMDIEPKIEREEANLGSDSVEVEDLVRSDIERWKEVEHLFLSANQQNGEVLKNYERTFDPEFLFEWLCSTASLKL